MYIRIAIIALNCTTDIPKQKFRFGEKTYLFASNYDGLIV